MKKIIQAFAGFRNNLLHLTQKCAHFGSYFARLYHKPCKIQNDALHLPYIANFGRDRQK